MCTVCRKELVWFDVGPPGSLLLGATQVPLSSYFYTTTLLLLYFRQSWMLCLSMLTLLAQFTASSCCRLFSSFNSDRKHNLCDFRSQNHLLEIGWNKSQATQLDVEKTLNCCGFSKVNYNGTCAAVSDSSGCGLMWTCLWELLNIPHFLPLLVALL